MGVSGNVLPRACAGMARSRRSLASDRKKGRDTFRSSPALTEEAENCRLQALSYLGTREASLLLRIAREFDDLEQRQQRRPARPIDPIQVAEARP